MNNAFAAAWVIQAGLMTISALGAISASVLFMCLSLAMREPPIPREWLPYLTMYMIAAAIQVGLGLYGISGALALFRGHPQGPPRLRKVSALFLVFFAGSSFLVLGLLISFMGWRHPFVAMSTLVLIASGVILAVLPVATLKWRPGQVADR